jgi:aspartate 1-decarboxylase
MLLSILKSKIHRATVTESNLNYEGSITIDAGLMREAGLMPGEKVHVANLSNGARIETYAMEGAAGSGVICMNGGAALHAKKGDIVIIMVYALMTPEEASTFKAKIVKVDPNNRIAKGR